MPKPTYTFDYDSVKRVADAVRRVEAQVLNVSARLRQLENIRLVPVTQVRPGKLAEDIAVGETGEVDRYLGAAGEETSFDSKTVSDWFRTGGATDDPVLVFRGPHSGGETLYFMRTSASPKARYIRFTLPSALTTSQSSKASCTVDDYWDGPDPGSSVTVYNPNASSNYIFEGDNGNKGIAVYDDKDSKYWIVQLQCPA